MPPSPSALTTPLTAARLVVTRDLMLAFRRPEQLLHPLAFYVLVTTLFTLSSATPERSVLRTLAPGVLWVAALLAALLALDFLFRDDAQDGTLEQYALSGQSLTWLLLGKTAAHWLLTGVPLAVMAPLMGYTLGVPGSASVGIMLTVALGSLALSFIGSIGAALTLGARRGGVLLAILILPLAAPILIFGSNATELAIRGQAYVAPMELLGAIVVLSFTLAPLAAAAAVRISLE
ncbi:MAG TPA: heme exporter protein CcmB [Steroidobacteraceae bacterium]|nr:heme exporter protein CcmB [Steroidobacteraceae bacterium]